jgi:hypothetical protein
VRGYARAHASFYTERIVHRRRLERLAAGTLGYSYRMPAIAVPSIKKHRVTRLAAIIAASVMLSWPAIWNRLPLLFPDSLGYLLAGQGVWTKLLGIPTPVWKYASDRSEIFAAGLFLLHRGSAVETFVMVLALLTAWILWLLCRSFVPRERLVQVYLALAFILSFTTGAAWYVSAILADALGPILYFGIFLLIFEADKLSRWEKGLLYIVAFWAAASHPTHLLVAAGFCTVFGLLWLFRWREIQRRGVGLARVALVLLAAIVAQVGVHVRLYHRLSVFGNPPAFLMARLIGDGPARNYLQQHCSTLSWTICTHIKDLPTNEADFLWPSASIWRTSDWDQQEQLRREQFPLLLGTLRSYPKEQIAISWHNFTHMLFVVGPTDFGDSPLFERQAADFIVPGLGTVTPTLDRVGTSCRSCSFGTWSDRFLRLPCSSPSLALSGFTDRERRIWLSSLE